MISVIILTKNEEKNIKDCLKTLGFADEIIVIDDNSTDKTAETAKSLGAKVFIHPLDEDFSQQRNFGLEKAGGDWVLFVDADERVSISLADEIVRLTNWPNSDVGFFIKRVDVMWGKELKHGETGSIKLLRLARKGSGQWEGKVHEKWLIKEKLGQLNNPLHHYPHQTLTEFLQEINFYTSIRSKELFDQGKTCSFLSIIFYPLGKFMLNYFLKEGIRDGVAGLILALVMSFHSFLVRGKQWLLWQRNKI